MSNYNVSIMKIKIKNLLSLIVVILICSCASSNGEKLTKATVNTNMGSVEFVLLNETPLHKANFIKMAKEGFFDEMQFHRVIKQFVVQTGNQNSKNLHADSTLIDGGAEHLIEPEFISKFHHTRGAVGAAREGDDVNPERKSSGSHFYFVQGHNFEKVNDALLDQNNISDPEVRASYLENGGTPHLDGAYTIFGYVVKGMSVIDTIAEVETGMGDRPKKNVIIKSIEFSEVDSTVLTDNKSYSYLKEK